MSGSEHARPVWLTPEQRRLLTLYDGSMPLVNECDRIAAQWDAAPADPAEAVLDALEAVDVHVVGSTTAVLRALGHPKEPA